MLADAAVGEDSVPPAMAVDADRRGGSAVLHGVRGTAQRLPHVLPYGFFMARSIY